MKRIISLVLLAVILAGTVPVFAQGFGARVNQTDATKKKHRRKHRHHKNHHKGHLRPDPYPAAQ